MLYTDKPESFWTCAKNQNEWDIVDIILLIMEWIGLIPGFILMILLGKLDGKTRTSLLMLRTMTICTFMQLLINFLNNIYPYPINTASTEFNLFICGLWSSRFLYLTFAIIGVHAFVYFSTNRTMQIVENLQFSFASSRNIDLVYIAGFTVYSMVITVPQTLTLNYGKSSCSCEEELMNFTFLQLVYARIYIFFFQVFILNFIGLAICCGLIINWVKRTPKEKFYDTLNALSFPNTPEAELKAYDRVKGWSTSSMCIVPLTCTFFFAFSYDSIYQFISVIGVTKYNYSGMSQKVSQLFLLIHPVALPYILFYYIPALRFWVVRRWHQLRGRRQVPDFPKNGK
ncbi:unnamed protein product [Hymenolepis diminuta]|uniref:G_PROTEIN_RECEP_F1_2 domain-containing protein n=1 Tax=Hymenolepis diminuta TaxID=6216 RepID=A0A564YSA5_HYMDI|nr:unnamed protein product [Hymenolepis diminuta]